MLRDHLDPMAAGPFRENVRLPLVPARASSCLLIGLYTAPTEMNGSMDGYCIFGAGGHAKDLIAQISIDRGVEAINCLVDDFEPNRLVVGVETLSFMMEARRRFAEAYICDVEVPYRRAILQRRSHTTIPALLNRRSTCLIACLSIRPRACASACPITGTANDAPVRTPASHWPAKESAWRASSPKTCASENHEPIPSDRSTCA